jgi:hypothetical protein
MYNGGTASAQPGESATAYSEVAVEDHHAEAILCEAEELLRVRYAEAARDEMKIKIELVLIENTRLRTRLMSKWEIGKMQREW